MSLFLAGNIGDELTWKWDGDGDSFCYFASSSSLMRERSRSVAADEIGKAVMSSSRCVPVQRRNGGITEYIVQAIDGEPRQVPIIPQPVRTRTRVQV
jgi:hypothetical protein